MGLVSMKRGAYHWEQIGKHPLKANAFVKARYQLCIDLLKRHQPPHNNQSVLDLGCGDGALTWMLLQSGYSASGIDTLRIRNSVSQARTSKKE